jgi:cellulose biosynthesis protein BcsQ
MDIVVTADKGGVGKSLMAAHIAGRLDQLGQPVTLVDLDHRLASSRQLGQAAPHVPLVKVGSSDILADGLCIWDTPAHPDREMRLGMVGGHVIIVTDTDMEGLLAARDLYRTLASVGAQARVLVNNLAPTSGVGPIDDLFSSFEVPCFRTAVRRYACYGRARTEGRLVCDYPYAKADEAWSDIKNVCDELLEMIDA